ncbi:disease resistance protein RPM1 [Eucalyptus grandis]|uniref:disease resistance protein RPM1 n=1 Tax=Eucalyptus grandis TaxID=71139 RepID=UPI00192F04C5|nr:disease resistance protein RPM1 [Eucalyptus grandis]
MTESAVSCLVEKLSMFVEQEVNLLKGVRGEIELIRDEFERMKAFLEHTESSKDDDPELKVWVKQVRDVAYDVEDILDEYTLNLARDHGDGVMRYLHKIKLSINNLKERCHLSSKIIDIRTKVLSISEGHRRYHFKSYCTEQSASASIGGTSWHDLREDTFPVEEGELVGIDQPREELIKWLVDGEPGLEVVSILGIRGSGKTTLAERVYNNHQVKAYFQSHAWISVSQSYKIQDILRDMIEQLHGEIEQRAPRGIESANSVRLKQILKDFLHQKRYVIVLDDVWNLEALEEGFIEERERISQEEVAQRYLNELINRNLVQITKELHERVRRLSVQYNCNNALNQLNLPSLRSLLIFHLRTSSSTDEQFFPTSSKLLRVLDLGGSCLHKFPQEILVFVHLKYLSLRRSNVRIIPRSIVKLQNLETLDFVSKMPLEITKLKKLQHLLVYSDAEITTSVPFGIRKGFLAPKGIGALTSLQNLCCVKAGGGQSKNTMQELGGLSQLRRLGVRDLKKDDAKELCHSIEKMTNLQSLDVNAESEYDIIDLDFLSSAPPFLRDLYIGGCLKKLPHWLPLLTSLTKLRLAWTKLKSSPLIALQNLPNLVELYLSNAFDGKTLVFGDKGFPKLKKLFFANLENLRFALMNGQAMPCLQSLIIIGCKHLDWQSLLVVIRGLANLKHLQFYEMPEEFALAFYPYSHNIMRKGIMQEHYEEVMERNPKVYFFWWKEDHRERHDLSLNSYEVIKGRVMSRIEVIPKVS